MNTTPYTLSLPAGESYNFGEMDMGTPAVKYVAPQEYVAATEDTPEIPAIEEVLAQPPAPIFTSGPIERTYTTPGTYTYITQSDNITHSFTVVPGDQYNIIERDESIEGSTKTITIIYDSIIDGSRNQLIYTEEYVAPTPVEIITVDDLNDAIIALTELIGA